MLTSYFHCDAYRLADVIVSQTEEARDKIIAEVEDYLEVSDTTVAYPVYFQNLLEYYDEDTIAKYLYDALVTYVDEPVGKIYLDF